MAYTRERLSELLDDHVGPALGGAFVTVAAARLVYPVLPPAGELAFYGLAGALVAVGVMALAIRPADEEADEETEEVEV